MCGVIVSSLFVVPSLQGYSGFGFCPISRNVCLERAVMSHCPLAPTSHSAALSGCWDWCSRHPANGNPDGFRGEGSAVLKTAWELLCVQSWAEGPCWC